MTYPEFFKNIETIKLQDDLSLFLGAFEDGIIEFSYLDVVKTAGHSCPTVLGAYLMKSYSLSLSKTTLLFFVAIFFIIQCHDNTTSTNNSQALLTVRDRITTYKQILFL